MIEGVILTPLKIIPGDSDDVLHVIKRTESSFCGFGEISEVTLSRHNHQRLTVPPMIWMGFKGVEKELNMLLDVSDIPHDPDEIDRIDAYNNHINYVWD